MKQKKSYIRLSSISTVAMFRTSITACGAEEITSTGDPEVSEFVNQKFLQLN